MKSSFSRNALYFAVIASLNSFSAVAQEATADSGQAVQLDQLVVTAQRHEQKLQETPVSVSVFSPQQLEHKAVARIDELKYDIPNVTIQQNTATSSGAKIFLRGVGQDESMFTSDPAIAIYIDDVYIPRQNGAMFDLLDVERIEVLRGPQGTLYGRNATGGAIRYITRKPKGDDRLVAELTVGNLGRLDGRVLYNARVGEQTDISASVMSRHRDGTTVNESTGDKVNDSSVLAARVGVSQPVGEASTLHLVADVLRESSGPAFPSPVRRVDGKTVPVLGNLYRTRSDLVDGINRMEQEGIAATLETDLGWGLMRNVAHFRQMEAEIHVDVDATEEMRYHLYQDQDQSQHGYELQLISTGDGPVSWTGGAFYFHEANNQPTRTDIRATGGTNIVAQDTDAMALYAQATWAVNDRLNLTFGGRYSYERKDLSIDAFRANGAVNWSVRKKQSWSSPDWKFIADYDLSDNLMAFASVATGFKSGGFNGRGSSPATVTTIDEEVLTSVEAGLKAQLWDNRLRLNATYYRNDYEALQLSAVDANGVLFVMNASGALIDGIELEAQAQVTRHLDLSATVGTIDAKYKDYEPWNAGRFEGKTLKHAPELQWQFSANYVRPVGNGKVVATGQVAYTDKYYQNQELSELHATPAHTIVNGRLAYEHDGGKWSVGLWGKNLTDKQVSAGGFDIPGVGVAVIYPNLPRTFGLDLRYRFW